jgi:hypothetical protein
MEFHRNFAPSPRRLPPAPFSKGGGISRNIAPGGEYPRNIAPCNCYRKGEIFNEEENPKR